MSAPVGVSAPRGGLFPEGVWSGGVSAPGGMSASVHTGIPHPPVNRITHTCKNITLATTSLRPVIIE